MTDIPADAVEDVARAYEGLNFVEQSEIGVDAFRAGLRFKQLESARAAITAYLSHIEGKVSDYEAAQNGRGLL